MRTIGVVRERPSALRLRSALRLLVLVAVAGCGDEATNGSSTARVSDPGPVHVHGLGVNPADGALFVATHTGLFRAASGEQRAERVAGRYQDTMGFAVVGPDRFLGSGHPDLREDLPPFLGLIDSKDAGKSWEKVSLQGKVDFHVLEASGRRIYGYGSDFESRQPRFLTSADRGRRWDRIDAPEPLISLAISPTNARSVVASGERRIYASENGGRSWSTVDAPAAGLLAWNANGVFLAGDDGRVWRRPRDGSSWQPAGSIGGQPSAFDNGRGLELLAALHDGTIKRSADDGRSWAVRSTPR